MESFLSMLTSFAANFQHGAVSVERKHPATQEHKAEEDCNFQGPQDLGNYLSVLRQAYICSGSRPLPFFCACSTLIQASNGLNPTLATLLRGHSTPHKSILLFLFSAARKIHPCGPQIGTCHPDLVRARIELKTRAEPSLHVSQTPVGSNLCGRPSSCLATKP